MLIMISSSIPSGRIVDVSTKCNTIVVGLMKDCRFRANIVYFVITLIAAPKSMRLLGIGIFLMLTLTIGLRGFRYLGLIALPNMRSARCLIALMVGGSCFLLPCLFMQVYLMNLLQMGMSLIA